MADISTLAAELLAWLDERAESHGNGKVLPRTYAEQFKQSLGRLWRASRSTDCRQRLDTAAKDGLKRLEELVHWDVFYDKIRLHNEDNPDIAWDEFSPPVWGDWSTNPDTFDGLCKALRLIAKDEDSREHQQPPERERCIMPEPLIPAEHRTEPMSLDKAGESMGLGKRKGREVKTLINDPEHPLPAEPVGKKWVFDKRYLKNF